MEQTLATITTKHKPPAVHKVGRVRAALLQWLGVPIALGDSSFWQQFASGGESASGESIRTHDEF